uniref:Uncharacterized protein n=1 Tax=viral metagenome TaxID=1070528 RepID=A0A6M3L9K9_9ZZZZ
MPYYRITAYDFDNTKEVIGEDEDADIILDSVETCMQDLFDGSIRSLVVSRITGKAGMRDDL